MVTDEEFDDLEARVDDLESETTEQTNILRREGFIEDIDDVIEELFPDTNNPEQSKSLLRRTPEVFYIKGGYAAWGRGEYSWDDQDRAESDRQTLLDAYNAASSATKDEWFPESYAPVLDGPGLHVDEVGDRSAYQAWIDGYSFLQKTWPPDNELPEVVARRLRQIRIHDPATASQSDSITVSGGGSSLEGYHWTVEYATPSQKTEALAAANEVAAIVEDALEDLETNHPDNWSEYFDYTEIDVVTE